LDGTYSASEQAPQQQACAAPDINRTASRFPRVSHVQHTIYFLNIHMQQLQQKKEDR